MRGPLMFGLSTLVALSVPAGMAVAAVTASQDNTLYEITDAACPDLGSNGAGSNLFAGFNAEGEERRALVRFDLSSIPPGSTITSATLTLNLNKVAPQSPPEPFAIHRVTASWGEGTSNADTLMGGGDGAPATAGDATWCERFFGVTPWSVAGGDFAALASATTTVANAASPPTPAPQTWGSTPAMVADVQGWVDNPSSNYGWIVVDAPATRGLPPTARRFDSREGANAALRPQLVVTSLAIGEVPAASPWGLGVLAFLLAAAGSVALLRRR